MSAQDGNASPLLEDSNVGPGHGANDTRRSTTPESSDPSPILSYATAAEHPEDQAGLNSDNVSAKLHDVQIEDQPAGAAVQAVAGHAKIEGHANAQQDLGNVDSSVPDRLVDVSDDSEDELDIQEPPAYAQQDNVPEYDNDGHPGGLPQIYTMAGDLANLTTAPREFRTWDDYKLICLGGPKIALVFEEAEGQIELSCSRKLLKDLSVTFILMNDIMVRLDRLNITGFFEDLPVKSVAITFAQVYEMMQSGGLPVPISGDVSFMRLVDMYIMADFLIMPLIIDWIGTYVKAKIQELSTNWMRDYDTARMLEAVPEAKRHVDRFPMSHLSPLQLQAARLLDVQDAYMQARFNPRAKAVLPSELARLVSDSCPAELRFQLQAAGQLREEFLRALSIYDLRRRAEARRAVIDGHHH